MRKNIPLTEFKVILVTLLVTAALSYVAIAQTLSSGEFYAYVSDRLGEIYSNLLLKHLSRGDAQLSSDVPETCITDNSSIVVSNEVEANVTGPPVDTEPPIISNISMSPTEPTPSDEVIIRAKVVDEVCGVAQVLLSYSTDDGLTWTNVTMSPVDEEHYEGIIPGQPANTEVRYKIYACDKVGNWAVSNEYGYTVKALPEQPSSPSPAEVSMPALYYIVGGVIGATAAVTIIIIKKKEVVK